MQSYVFLPNRLPPQRFYSDVVSGGERPNLHLVGKRAVIVEDEGITQLQLKKILHAQGLQVVGSAGNGDDAVKVVLEQRPDLVLMDIRMPGINGLEASRRILATYPVCIVMLTAFSDEDYQEEAKQIGASGYVVKPISAETLIPKLVAAYERFKTQ